MAFLLPLAAAAAAAPVPPLPTATIGGDTYAATPSGWVLAHCVHEVPSNARIGWHEDGQRRVVRHPSLEAPRVLPLCQPLVNAANPVLRARGEAEVTAADGARGTPLPADYDGWLQYTVAKAKADTGFDGFLGEMSVPDVPKKRPQMLYLFPGLQNIDWIPKVNPEPNASNPFDIIQPVLQYPGARPNSWGVRSWYVTVNTGAIMSTDLAVEPGDAILCNMTRTGEFGWFIGSQIKSSGKQTNQNVDALHKGAIARLKTQPFAYNTLECYGCNGCATFPTQPCVFSDLRLRSKIGFTPVEWAANVKPAVKAECQERTVIHNSSAVTISFV